MATLVVHWLLLALTLIGYVFSDYTYKRPITYAGPIVYSDEKPPIIQFPGPPPANTYREPSYAGGYADSKSSITYVPLPLDDLPILIYQSKDKPPVHVLNRPSKTRQDSVGGRFYRTYSSPSSGYEAIDGGPGYDRGTYSGYGRSGGSYEAYSKVGKSYSSGGGGSSSYYGGATKQQPPHIVYSGHPPIHVYQQPTQSAGPSYGQAQTYTNAYNVPPQLRANHIPAPPTYHKPPIIIYQGVRPPVHVYNEPPPPTNFYGGSNAGYVGGYSSKNGEQWEPVGSSAQDVDKQPEVKMVTFAAEDKTEQEVLVVSDQDLELTTEADQNQETPV